MTITKTPTLSTEKKKNHFPFVKSLPHWFDLQNYRSAYQLDLEGWIVQLHLRRIAQDFYLPWVFTGVVDDYRIPEKKSTLTVAPVQDMTKREALTVTELVKVLLDIPSNVWNSPSLFNIFFRKNSDENSDINLINWLNHQEEKGVIDSQTPLCAPMPPFLVGGLASIDLAAPDVTLIAAFKQWLKTKRSKSKVRHISKTVLSRWAVNQVLPYLDLMSWARLTKVQIPHWMMGDTLFPSRIQGDKVDRVRKTTESTARIVMNNSCLYAMVAQLKHEKGKSLDLDSYLENMNQIQTKYRIIIP